MSEKVTHETNEHEVSKKENDNTMDSKSVMVSSEIENPSALKSSRRKFTIKKKDYIDSAEELNKSSEKKKVIFKRLFIAFFVIFTVGVIVGTAWSDFSNGSAVSWSVIWKTIKYNWFYLLFALITFAMCIIFRGLTLSSMMFSITKKPKLGLCMGTALVGKYYDYVTPLGAGGQPFQMLHLSRHKEIPQGLSVALPVAEFTINRIAFVVMVITALCLNAFVGFQTSITSTATIVLAIVGIVLNCFMPTLILLFVLWPKCGEFLVRIGIKIGAKLGFVKRPESLYERTLISMKKNAESIKYMTKNWFLILVSFVFSLAAEVSVCSIAFFVLKTFGYESNTNIVMEWLQIVCVCAILYSAVSFVPTPGNAGASELSFYWLFSSSLVAGICFSAMITWRLFSFYSFLLAGLIQILVSTIIKKRNNRKTIHIEGDTSHD